MQHAIHPYTAPVPGRHARWRPFPLPSLLICQFGVVGRVIHTSRVQGTGTPRTLYAPQGDVNLSDEFENCFHADGK